MRIAVNSIVATYSLTSSARILFRFHRAGLARLRSLIASDPKGCERAVEGDTAPTA
jgi:hypothetical protein